MVRLLVMWPWLKISNYAGIIVYKNSDKEKKREKACIANRKERITCCYFYEKLSSNWYFGTHAGAPSMSVHMTQNWNLNWFEISMPFVKLHRKSQVGLTPHQNPMWMQIQSWSELKLSFDADIGDIVALGYCVALWVGLCFVDRSNYNAIFESSCCVEFM